MYSHQKHRLITFIATLVAYTGAARAQTRLSGAVVDSISHQNMEGASVRLVTIHGKDTTPVAGTIAKSGGRFNFNHVESGTYHLSVSFQGYVPYWHAVTVGEEAEHVTLFMYPAAYELQGLVITDTRPVLMHGDTTAYKADQFHTAPNAAVGDLLRKMPGIDLVNSGTVVAQGDTVKRILVNGKRFFSNDLQVALKYLPRDVVSTIEIFDDKSDQAKFTGVDDGIRIRTINIVLKKNIKSGVFGQASMEAGGSTGSNSAPGVLYKGEVSINHFRGESMTSVIGDADNDEPVMGGMASAGTGGVNYSNHWGQHTQVSGSYRMVTRSGKASTSTYTQNLIPGDSSINANASNTSSNYSINHVIDANLETDPTKSDHMILHGSMTIDGQHTSSGSQTSSTQGLTVPLNTSIVQAGERGHDLHGSLSAVWGHRFAKAGRSASIDATVETVSGSGNGTNKFDNTYFKTGGSDSASRVNQYYTVPNDHLTANVHATYEEPLFKNNSLQLEYTFSSDQSTTGRSTFDLDSVSGDYSHVDTALSNHFKNSYSYHQGGVKYHYGNKLLQVTAGMGLQAGVYRSADQTHDTTLQEGYTLIHPMASLNLNPKKGLSMSISYEGQGEVPPINNLQPVVNNTNPLNITVGNPNLRQAFTHSITGGVNSFDPDASHHLFSFFEASITENSIVTATRINAATGVDTSTYTNLNGTYHLRLFAEYGFRLKHPASNLSFGPNIAEFHTRGYINTTLNNTNNIYISGSVKWTTNLPNHVDLNLAYSPSYNIGTYSAEPNQNTHYVAHSGTLDGTYYTDSGWQLKSIFNYRSSSGRPVGYNPTAIMWNMSLSKFVLKHKAGEIKLSMYNILDKVATVNNSITATQIQNTTGTMLGRYALIGFVYHLSPDKQN